MPAEHSGRGATDVQPDLLLGRSLGSYVIEEWLGSGAFASVYIARHQHLGIRRALKVMKRELAEQPHFQQRFLQEARTAAALSHPNIVPVYDFGIEENVHYLVMELVLSQTLARRMEERRVLGELQLHWILDIGKALDYAHDQGVVHRDVKPTNILVRDSDNVALLTDFGIAHWTNAADLTETGFSVGTYAYMSPEQCAGTKTLDRRSDIYSFAVVLYELLAAQPPYGRGVSAVAGHLDQPPPSVQLANPYLPQGADAVLARGLAKLPEERYETAGDLARDLVSALGGAEDRTRPAIPSIRRPTRTRGKEFHWPAALPPQVAVSVLALTAILTLGYLVLIGTIPWLKTSPVAAVRASPVKASVQPAPTVPPLVTPDEASTVVSRWIDDRNQAMTKRDTTLIAAIDGSPSLEEDLRLARSASPPTGLNATTVIVYVPRQSAYPAQFLSLATLTGPGNPPIYYFMMFTQQDATAPWHQVLRSMLEINTPPPAIAVDADGYASLVSDAQTRNLVQAPASLSKEMVAYARKAIDSPTPPATSVFASGQYVEGWAQQLYGSSHVNTGACQCPAKLTFASNDGPVSAYRETGGGAFVLFQLSMSGTQTPVRGYLNIGSSGDYGGALAHGIYRSITFHTLAVRGATIAPIVSGAPVDIVANSESITSAEGVKS